MQLLDENRQRYPLIEQTFKSNVRMCITHTCQIMIQNKSRIVNSSHTHSTQQLSFT